MHRVAWQRPVPPQSPVARACITHPVASRPRDRCMCRTFTHRPSAASPPGPANGGCSTAERASRVQWRIDLDGGGICSAFAGS
jgi:hypothetical protein